MGTTEDAGSARQEAESVACGPSAAPAMPASTASRGSNQEVSSAAPCVTGTTSDETLSMQPSLSDGDVLPERLPDGRLCVPIITGRLKGVYVIQHNKVICGGHEMAPTQFEAAGGRVASRKWRMSLRVLLPNGTAGMRLGPWLREHGYDTRPVAPKRKRDPPLLASRALLSALRCAASEPSSPAGRQLSLSPSKSARMELQSLPGSPCCPHCRRGGGGGGGAPVAAPSLPTSQCSGGSEGSHQPAPGSSGTQAAAVKRSLEAFLASLPPSAQAALGHTAVGGGAEAGLAGQQHPRPQQRAPQQQQRLQPPLQPPVATFLPHPAAAAAAAGAWDSQARSVSPPAAAAPSQQPSMQGVPMQPRGPAPQPWIPLPLHARAAPFPPQSMPPMSAYYALPPYPYPPAVPMPPFPGPPPPGWWPGLPMPMPPGMPPQGDAAHYLLSEAAPKPFKTRRSRAPASVAVSKPSLLQQQHQAVVRQQQAEAAAAAAAMQQRQQPRPPAPLQAQLSGSLGRAAGKGDAWAGLEDCVPVMPEPSMPSAPSAAAEQPRSAVRRGAGGSGAQTAPSLPMVQTQGSFAGLSADGLPLETVPLVKADPVEAPAAQGGAAKPHAGPAVTTQQAQQQQEEEQQQHRGGAEELGTEDDLAWLLQEGDDLDLSALLKQDGSPQHPAPQQAQQGEAGAGTEAEGAPARAAGRAEGEGQGIEGEEGSLPFSPMAGCLLTPLHTLCGAGTPRAAAAAGAGQSGGAAAGAGDDWGQVDFLAELLRSVLPSPSEEGPCRLPLPTPLPLPPLGQQLQQQAVEQQQAGAAKREGENAAAGTGTKAPLPSPGSSFDLKVFAGMSPPVDGPFSFSEGVLEPGLSPSPFLSWMDL